MIGARRFLEDSREISRRSFLAILGWGGFIVASLIASFQSIRFIFPNATYEVPSAFKVGAPSDYAVGSTTVFIDKRVVINRDPNGIYAFNLICTHLGCTPRSFPDVTSDLVASGITGIRDPLTGQAASRANPALPGFKCPCHGSRYSATRSISMNQLRGPWTTSRARWPPTGACWSIGRVLSTF